MAMRSAKSRRAPSSPCGCSDNPGLCPAPLQFWLAVTVLRGRYEDALASSTAPRGLHVLAVQAIYDLQSADGWCNLQLAYQTAVAYQIAFGDFLCYFIRKRRLAYIVCIGFSNAEYHVIRVDFIVALRRTKGRGRRTLRSPPSPSSGLHLIHPGNPLRRGILAAAVYTNLGSLYPVLSLLPSSEYGLAVCVRLCIARVSVGVLGLYLSFFIIGR